MSKWYINVPNKNSAGRGVTSLYLETNTFLILASSENDIILTPKEFFE